MTDILMSRITNAHPTTGPRPPVDLEVIVPVFNEERRLARTLDATISFLLDRPWDSAIVVVDNGCVDRTVDIVDRCDDRGIPIHVIGCASRGKGAAVRRGILSGSSRHVGFMDADLATPIEALDTVMSLLQDGHKAVVGSRYGATSQVETRQGGLRRMGGRFFRSIGNLVVDDMDDTQCGFKFFEGAAAREAIESCTVDGFAFDLELLARVRALDIEIIEIPVAWRDVTGSTFSPARDGLRSLRDVLAIRRRLVREGVVW